MNSLFCFVVKFYLHYIHFLQRLSHRLPSDLERRQLRQQYQGQKVSSCTILIRSVQSTDFAMAAH